MAKRFIKLYEQITDWEWFRQPNTLSLFIYLLVKAYYKDTTIGGRVIRRGQLVTSLPKLATGTGLTIRQTRTALTHLISTGEVTDESSNQNRIITIVRYDEYQSSTDESTGKRQANDRRVDRQTTDESTPYIEYIESIERDRNIESLSTREKGIAKRFTPPTLEEIQSFCQENGIDLNAERFFDYYASRGWKVGNRILKDWQAKAKEWAKEDAMKKAASSPRPAPAPKRVIAQDYDQRDYSEIDEYWNKRQENRILEMRRRNNGEA